jgi:hypothetical protein
MTNKWIFVESSFPSHVKRSFALKQPSLDSIGLSTARYHNWIKRPLLGGFGERVLDQGDGFFAG